MNVATALTIGTWAIVISTVAPNWGWRLLTILISAFAYGYVGWRTDRKDREGGP